MDILKEIKKPFNIITLSLTVFSIILSVFFFWSTQKKKILSYSISETPAIIYDSKNSISAIKIYEKDSIPINENIFLLNGSIWNNGDIPIYKTDVRTPIILELNNRILEYKITAQTNENISKFTFEKKSDSTLKLDWKFFDPNQGFNFQIIYVGTAETGFLLKGNVLDIPSFNKVEFKKPVSNIFKVVILSSYLLMFVLTIVFNYKTFKKERKRSITMTILTIIMIGLPFCALIYYVNEFFFNTSFTL